MILSDAAFDPTQGMPTDAERGRRVLDAVLDKWSRYDLWGDRRDD